MRSPLCDVKHKCTLCMSHSKEIHDDLSRTGRSILDTVLQQYLNIGSVSAQALLEKHVFPVLISSDAALSHAHVVENLKYLNYMFQHATFREMIQKRLENASVTIPLPICRMNANNRWKTEPDLYRVTPSSPADFPCHFPPSEY